MLALLLVASMCLYISRRRYSIDLSHRHYNVTPLRRRICKPLIRRSYKAFAVNSVRKNATTKAAIVKIVGQDLQKEIAAICSDNFESVTRQKSNSIMTDFSHVKASLLHEIKIRAPTLFSLLNLCLKTRKPRKNVDAIVVMIASLLCKHRRPSACQLQRFISLILYAGHSNKQVSEHDSYVLMWLLLFNQSRFSSDFRSLGSAYPILALSN